MVEIRTKIASHFRVHISVRNSTKADINESIICIENLENVDEYVGLSKEDLYESVLIHANSINIQIEELNEGVIASISDTFIIKSFDNMNKSQLEEEISRLRIDFEKY